MEGREVFFVANPRRARGGQDFAGLIAQMLIDHARGAPPRDAFAHRARGVALKEVGLKRGDLGQEVIGAGHGVFVRNQRRDAFFLAQDQTAKLARVFRGLQTLVQHRLLRLEPAHDGEPVLARDKQQAARIEAVVDEGAA